MRIQTIVTLLLWAMVSGPLYAQASGDEAVLDMAQAFRLGDRKKLTSLLPQLRGHALEPWAAYWELKARLDEASAAEVQEFFRRFAGTYQEDRLRADWLLLLGSRRDWAAFASEYPRYRMKDDKELRCYALLIEQLQGSATPAPERAAQVRADWLAQRDADDGCTLAADRYLDAKLLSIADVWRRARLAVEANRPRAALAAVTLAAPALTHVLTELSANPTRYLASRATAGGADRRELVVLALIKLASSDADAAARLLDTKWSVQLHPAQSHWLWGVIGKQAAQRQSPQASTYFDQADDAALSDDLLAWKVRAALRSPVGIRWAVVAKAVSAMSPAARADSAWVYWQARALRAQVATAAQAQTLLESIAGPGGFYEQLAQEELGRSLQVPAAPAPPSAAERSAIRLHPGLNRALYAIGLGLRAEGNREWNYSVHLAQPGGMEERQLVAAAQWACERQVWDRCINTSERSRSGADFAQLYPTPFAETVLKGSRESGLDSALVYGLMRQESRFMTDARSSVGASGLMQIMPATARWTARKIGLSGFSVEQLADRETNIKLGLAYLKLLVEQFDGSLPLATAAYNAGPSRARAWRQGPALEGAAWVETIPFYETREYVKKVLANAACYSVVLHLPAWSPKNRLTRIAPRDASSAEPTPDLP